MHRGPTLSALLTALAIGAVALSAAGPAYAEPASQTEAAVVTFDLTATSAANVTATLRGNLVWADEPTDEVVPSYSTSADGVLRAELTVGETVASFPAAWAGGVAPSDSSITNATAILAGLMDLLSAMAVIDSEALCPTDPAVVTSTPAPAPDSMPVDAPLAVPEANGTVDVRLFDGLATATTHLDTAETIAVLTNSKAVTLTVLITGGHHPITAEIALPQASCKIAPEAPTGRGASVEAADTGFVAADTFVRIGEITVPLAPVTVLTAEDTPSLAVAIVESTDPAPTAVHPPAVARAGASPPANAAGAPVRDHLVRRYAEESPFNRPINSAPTRRAPRADVAVPATKTTKRNPFTYVGTSGAGAGVDVPAGASAATAAIAPATASEVRLAATGADLVGMSVTGLVLLSLGGVLYGWSSAWSASGRREPPRADNI